MWFVVSPPPPKKIPANLPVQAITKAEQIIAQLPDLIKATALDRLISYLFIRKEAIESSRMEGTMSTIDHILTPGETFDDFKAKSEGASVRGYATALEDELMGVSKKGLSIFTVELIKRLHKNTMIQDPKFRGIPGKIRTSKELSDVVCIQGNTRDPKDSIYNPTPPQYVLQSLREVMKWIGDKHLTSQSIAGVGMPLLLRLAIGHSHFEAIHPFTDGNGRVGRMLLALQMASHFKTPLYLSGFIEEQKQDYGRVLQAAQKKLNYSPLIEFFSEAIVSSHQESQKTREVLTQLPETWLLRGNFRKNSTAEKALPWLLEHPIFTAAHLQKKFKVSPQAANTAVQLLVEHRVVRERTGQERNRHFAAEEVIALLARPYGSSAKEAMKQAQALIARAAKK